MKMLLRTGMVLGLLALSNPAPVPAQLMSQSPLVGKAAPDFTLSTLKAKDLNMTKFRDGRGAILFFWATWCPHCRSQMSVLQKRAQEFAQNEIKILLIAVGEEKARVQDFVRRNNISFEVFLDEEVSLSDDYGVFGIPMFVLVDPKGIVRDVTYRLPEDASSLVSIPYLQDYPQDSLPASAVSENH